MFIFFFVQNINVAKYQTCYLPDINTCRRYLRFVNQYLFHIHDTYIYILFLEIYLQKLTKTKYLAIKHCFISTYLKRQYVCLFLIFLNDSHISHRHEYHTNVFRVVKYWTNIYVYRYFCHLLMAAWIFDKFYMYVTNINTAQYIHTKLKYKIQLSRYIQTIYHFLV